MPVANTRRRSYDESMALEMKAACERCKAAISRADNAYICSFECTFCQDCAVDMGNVCPNCGGELARRPLKSEA